MADVYNSYLQMRDKYFGSDGAAAAEDVLNIVILVHMASIYMQDRTAYDQLQKSNNVAGKEIKVDTTTQVLALIGVILCILRIASHRFMKERPIIELLFSLITWSIFLIVIIVASQNNTAINNAINDTPNPTPAPSTGLVAQNNVLNLALSSSTYELNLGILGFVVTTIYTLLCVFRLIYSPEGASSADAQ